jgi:hypothetical protein
MRGLAPGHPVHDDLDDRRVDHPGSTGITDISQVMWPARGIAPPADRGRWDDGRLDHGFNAKIRPGVRLKSGPLPASKGLGGCILAPLE